MPSVVIIRLTPASPVAGASFTSYLSTLSIKAFDLSFGNPRDGVLVGTASGAWSPPSTDPTDPGLHDMGPDAPRIFQHYSLVVINPVGPVVVVEEEAVATAVIVLNPPAGHAEYQGPDLRLEVSNNGRAILDTRLDFNVAVLPDPATIDPAAYIALDAGAYFSLPDPVLGLDPAVAWVPVPADGTAPPFATVFKAVNLVLAQDPGAGATLATRSPLSAAEARQIAREITWNRQLAPAPVPPRPLEEMYTRPHAGLSGDAEKQADMDRKQFEATQLGYHATQDANADRLSQYVYAASAAVWAEAQTGPAIARAGLRFPVDPLGATTSAHLREAQVVLLPANGLTLDFRVPADYFYALGATFAPAVNPGQRFQMATLADETRLVAELQQAIDSGIITPQAITIENAARRLVALGTTSATSVPLCELDADVAALVGAWLAFMGPDIAPFWSMAAAGPLAGGYLDVVLAAATEQVVVTAASRNLLAAIRTELSTHTVAQLAAVTSSGWQLFFLGSGSVPGPNVGLLPPFTSPGTPQERVAAFVRQLRKFFQVQNEAVPQTTDLVPSIPTLSIPGADPISTFIGLYNANPTPAFTFGQAIDAGFFDQAVLDVFPDDAPAQDWLAQALRAIDALFTMTKSSVPADLQMALMEALYARGFDSAASVQALDAASFADALVGSVAWPFAAAIYSAAGGSGGSGGAMPPGPFQSVNPDGSLVNCIPPWHLSPLGPVQYLHDLLQVSAASTCDDPAPRGQVTLGQLLAGRRGDLGALQASAANLHTAVPLIDLVNENLEALASGAGGGAVYDTACDELAGHLLRPAGADDDCARDETPFRHPPETLFGAIAEHATCAVPVALPSGYDLLQADFSAPALPYAQPLDITRSYLRQLGSSRHHAMRSFRAQITEFVLAPAQEPVDFQHHLWRYPVRFDIALELLGMAPADYATLYSAPPASQAALAAWYGFLPDVKNWVDVVLDVPAFLARTGLDYCAFLALADSGFVDMHPARGNANAGDAFPVCEPCCAGDVRIVLPGDPLEALARLAVFIRLWRSLRAVDNAGYTFTQLADICDVLGLFSGGAVNPDFIRQLAAFQMLRDDFRLDLGDHGAPAGATGAARCRLLGLWSATPSDWAVAHLLNHVAAAAETNHHREYGCACREDATFMKVVHANLDALSALGGFDPAGADTWHARPASTLRFAEILWKIYLSRFTVGELLFLFDVQPHLDGDDPFPQEDANEALDLPFDLPEDERHRLWTLRAALLDTSVDDAAASRWHWHAIAHSLRADFGYDPGAGPDHLQALGEHFFPSILAAEGHVAGPLQRQYRTPLTATVAGRWNMPLHGPFGYDAANGELWTRLPLRDADVIALLAHRDQLGVEERAAVQALYFAPRAALAPFALLFADVGHAEHALIEEADEPARWLYFQRAYALFHARCGVIARHLAAHVAHATGQDDAESELAWNLLRRLSADENPAGAPWERDDGAPPADLAWHLPGGGAFAALLGLTGTGLYGRFSDGAGTLWNEVRGPLRAFGAARDDANVPFPTILPALGLALPPAQLRYATLNNGMLYADADGRHLGGAQGFDACWSGVLIVEEGGCYRFFAGAPTPQGEAPDHACCGEARWRLRLQRGQRAWVLLNRGWEGAEAPDHASAPIMLRRGAYTITVDYAQDPAQFDAPPDVRPLRSGFEIKQQGPDTGEAIETLPLRRLYRDAKDGTLALDLDLPPAALATLAAHYTSSVRDIRRTYQRAFKAMLLAHRLRLSARMPERLGQSEAGYVLDHPAAFAGTSYFPGAAGAPYHVHQAWFDMNLLPVADVYLPKLPGADDRTAPSLKRRQALFDWFERLYDYSVMRRQRSHPHHHPHHEPAAWKLFLEASLQQPADCTELLLNLAIDLERAPLLLRFYPARTIAWQDLTDERWTLRVWHADLWIARMLRHVVPLALPAARPDLWAADAHDLAAGNANLTRFYQDACISVAPRRYQDLALLNDGLRLRARTALIAYLCGMNRVALPWHAGWFARTPGDLSDLLLIDVEAGLCERASRIEEATSAVLHFVARARLGLEPTLQPGQVFACSWDSMFATLRTWQACRRRTLYRENVIEWEALQSAGRTEAYRFLDGELRRATLTAATQGGMEFWPAPALPPHAPLIASQDAQPAQLRQFDQPERLGLMGTPERAGRPSWLAPSQRSGAVRGDTPNNPGRPSGPTTASIDGAVAVLNSFPGVTTLPLWIEAAVRLGTRFLRIAAAGVPPASAHLAPHHTGTGACCCTCGKVHPPLMDEYYFWLEDARHYTAPVQDADWGGVANDPTSDWHRAEKLPGLLDWPARPMVRLAWCKVHNGEFLPQRRSDHGAFVNPDSGVAELTFLGRFADSLRFSITSADPPPTGYPDLPPWGFRYEMAGDRAVVLPEVVATPEPSVVYPGGLASYPYFGYVAPGAPLMPGLFNPVLAIARALRTHCHNEAALKWYALLARPPEEDNRWARCRDTIVTGGNDGNGSGNDGPSRTSPASATAPVRGASDNPCCPSERAPDALVRRRAVLLEYLETLAQAGDAAWQCNRTPEGMQQARLLFDTMARVLGERPATIHSQDDVLARTVENFQARFAPLNPRLMALYDGLDTRRAALHACLTASRLRDARRHGALRDWAQPGAVAWNAPEPVCGQEEDCCCPRSPYRFQYLVQKAQEAAADVRNLGATLQVAFEKGDAEYLASLRARHENQLAMLNQEIRQNEWRDADWQVQALRKSKESALARRQYYAMLVANGLNGDEISYINLNGVATATRSAGNVVEAVGQVMNLIPDPTVGVAGIASSPVSVLGLPLGTKLAHAFSASARILFTVADITGTNAQLAFSEAGWARRLEDWVQQVTVLDIEIEQLERLILGAERRRDNALRQLNNLQQQQDQLAEVQDFLRDKFSSHTLYLYLQQELARLYSQMFEVAHCWAQQAQRAFNLERGHTTRNFLPAQAWNRLHEGLLAGEHLQLALRQMDKSYCDQNVRDYELTKHLSLRLHFPLAFLQLKTLGRCEIDVPEWLFDMDYPGHYLRSIKNLSVSIPCVAQPYTGVHCRVTLLSSMIRIAPSLLHTKHCCHDRADCCPHCASPAGYAASPSDPRIVRRFGATEAVATSSGLDDKGMFELNFRDERYLPFEYAGAVCRLRIELPPCNNQFDLDTVSDMLVHLNYTAREGGEALRQAACAASACCLPGAGLRFFDVQQDMGDAWYALQSAARCADGDVRLPLRLSRSMFPFLPGARAVRLRRLGLYFEAQGAQPSASRVVQFVAQPQRHGDASGCCAPLEMACIASAEWPCLYHGLLDAPPPALIGDGQEAMGAFHFPRAIGPIRRAYLVCMYEADGSGCCDLPPCSH